MIELRDYFRTLFSDPLVADIFLGLFSAVCASVLFKLFCFPFFKD